MKVLKKQIKKLQEEIKSSIEDLNSGGCIKFAYYLSQELHKQKIPFKICLTDKDDLVSFNYNDFYSPYHVLVYIPNIGFVDGYETFTLNRLRQKYRYCQTRKISLTKIYSFMKDHTWNDTYDPKYDHLLQELIKDNLNPDNRY